MAGQGNCRDIGATMHDISFPIAPFINEIAGNIRPQQPLSAKIPDRTLAAAIAAIYEQLQVTRAHRTPALASGSVTGAGAAGFSNDSITAATSASTMAPQVI